MATQIIGNYYDSDFIRYTQQRKLIKTSDNKLVLFFITADDDNAYIQYKVSTDNGTTWGSWITAISSGDDLFGEYFDIVIDASDNIYIAYGDDYDIYFRKLTYSLGTWSNGTVYTVKNDANRYTHLSLCLKSNGDIWIGARRRLTNYFDAFYSTNGGSSWSTTSVNTGALVQCVKLIPIDTNIHCIANCAGTIKQYKYTSSWDSGETVVSSVTSTDRIGVVKISNTEVWCFYDKSAGMEIKKWNGTSWEDATVLTDYYIDLYPGLANVGGKPVAVYCDYVNASSYNLVYQTFNGTSWGEKQTIANHTTYFEFSLLEYHETNLLLLYALTTA